MGTMGVKIVTGRRYRVGEREGIALDPRTGRAPDDFTPATQAALQADDGTVFVAAKRELRLMLPPGPEKLGEVLEEESYGQADA